MSASLLPVLAPGGCGAEAVIIDTDCIQATAVGLHKSGGGVSARGVKVEAGDKNSAGADCPDLVGADMVLFEESGDTPGYQEDEDTFVSTQSGELDTPSGSIKIGSVSTHSGGGNATAWATTITTTSGQTKFSGTF
jgi:hypothetical protein